MSVQKLLWRSGNGIARNLLSFPRNSGNRATSSYIYSPPTVKISFAEKVVLGLILTFSTLAYPAWVMYHVPEYQGEDREAMKNNK